MLKNKKICKISLIISSVLLSLNIQCCKDRMSFSNNIIYEENKNLIDDSELNTTLESYVDKFHSEIIRISNYNPERVDKIFCAHHTVYVETAVTEPNSIKAYLKLMCAESEGKIEEGISLSNFRTLNSKVILQKYPKEEKFKVITQETPRETPFYLEDLHHIFNNEDILDRLQNFNLKKEEDRKVVAMKAIDYQTQLQGCQNFKK